MSLSPGQRLGAYEVVSLHGAGGMGEVYKALDTRLGRTVALKVLHLHVAEDSSLRQRFEREARAVSQLNHPRICTLYDVGEYDGGLFLVMEFVDGETLAARLTRGRLSLESVIRHAIEIAEGLDHAHRAGITHRDLKPANVMLTRSGAKLLDFGLAKFRDRGAEVTSSLDRAVGKVAELREGSGAPPPTRVGSLTDPGTLLGTFEYMAPEQLQGHEADSRSDIFAFGAVLYEAVTGRKAFEATTPASLIGAILVTEPRPMGGDRLEVPPLLDLVVQRCFAKDPEERWQTVRDLLVPLRWIAEGVSAAGVSQTRVLARARLATVVALMVAALAAGLALWNAAVRPGTPEASLERWDLAIPTGLSLAAELFPSLAVSPDGTQLVFRAQVGATTQLYLRRLDEFEAHSIAGSVDGHTPFFSPDSRWIGFMANARIFRAPVEGGPATIICDAPSLSVVSPGASWGPDGTIIFASGASSLMRVSDAGGTPERLTAPDPERGEVLHIDPQFLPGGQEVLFRIRTGDDAWRLAVLNLANRQWKWLPPIGEVAGAQYVSTGHLVYAQAGGLYAVPLDLVEGAFRGPPLPLSDDVYTRIVGDALMAQFAVSENGVLAFVFGLPPERTLVSVSMDGTTGRPLADTPRMYRYPRFSPDGRHLAVTVEEERSDVYVVDDRGRLRKITKTGSNTIPVWTPDSARVTFSSRRAGSKSYDVYSVPLDESTDAEALLPRDGGQFPNEWSPRGDAFLFDELNNETGRDIWVWSPPDGTATKVIAGKANERAATFSPNGQWLAYVSNESGRDEIYVQRYPGPGGRETVSSGGGTEPVWSPSGSALYYRSNGQMFVVTLRTESRLVAEAPRMLFQDRHVPAPPESGRPNYDVSPDGKSFVMVRSDEPSPTHLHVVHNWSKQLRSSGAND